MSKEHYMSYSGEPLYYIVKIYKMDPKLVHIKVFMCKTFETKI
jgi:hypothetical protein